MRDFYFFTYDLDTTSNYKNPSITIKYASVMLYMFIPYQWCDLALKLALFSESHMCDYSYNPCQLYG